MRWQFDLRAFIPSVVAPRQRWHRSVADPPWLRGSGTLGATHLKYHGVDRLQCGA